AVRSLHAIIREQGESPELLGALVRAYANLGIQTEYHWNCAPKIFQARALLYSQRLVARDPKSPWGLWHRAYACTMAGLHGLALTDRAEAEKLAQANKDRPPPSWVSVIDAGCRFDLARLTKLANGTDKNLALFLRFMAADDTESVSFTVAAADVALQASPD